MKTSMMNLTMLMAGTMMLSGWQGLSAQSVALAKVPFEFKVSGTTLPPGEYQVKAERNAGAMLFAMTPVNGGKGVLIHPNNTIDPRDEKVTAAHLSFRCGSAASGCSLDQIWSSSHTGWKLRTPRPSPAERERMAVVNLSRDAAGQ